MRSSLLRWPTLLALLLLLGLLPSTQAQTITTAGSNPPYNGGNGVSGNGVITFGVTNTSGGDILLTDLASYWLAASIGANTTLWATTVPASMGGSYFPFVAGNWSVVGTGTNLSVPADGIQPTISGMTYLIPNGTSVRFLLESNQNIRYSGTGVISPNTFTVGGVSLQCGDVTLPGASGVVGYGGLFTNTGNINRYFTGSVTFIPATACSGQPTAGTISGPPFVCNGGTATLNVNGSTTGTGLTREWYSSSVSGGPYSTFVGSGTSVNTGVVTANTYYVCVVTCTASPLPNSDQTPEFFLPVTNAGPGGTFTIDNSLPTAGLNFNNFTDAITYLNGLSICGPFTGAYTFNVTAGHTFTEDPPLLTASGAAGLPITFQRSGVGANPVIAATGGAGTTDHAFGIRGGNYITVDGIDINGGAAVEYGYYIANASATVSANNNTIKNCTIDLDRTNTNSRGIMCTSSTTGGGFTPTAASGSNSNNSFLNFTITDVYSGIFVTSGSTSWPGTGNIVGTEAGGTSTIGADFVGLPTPDIGGSTTLAFGVQFNSQSDGQIFDVTVRNIASSAGINRGIYWVGCGGNSVVHGNRVYGVRNTSTTSTSGQRGIDVATLTTGTHNLRVYNNFVSNITGAYTGAATTTRMVTGIYVSNGAAGMTYEIDHNNVSLDNIGAASYSTVCLDFISATSVNRARGNTLANYTGNQTGTAVHFAIRTAGTTTFGAAGSESNYNNLYIANAGNGHIGQTSATNRTLLTDWTGALTGNPGTDASSIGADPLYVDNNSDLHVTGPDNDGAGPIAGLAWITTDIDGDPRPTPADIGADEYAPASCFPPTDVAVNVLSPTSADVTWTSTGALNYDYEVRTSGAAGSGPTGLAFSGTIAGSPINLLGLSDQTTYTVYVLSNCPGPIASNWSTGVSFTTPCLPVSTLPWTDSFEGATIDNGDPLICYTREIITGTGANTWRTRVTPIRNSIGPRTGTDYMAHSFNANSWLFTPGMQLTGGQTYEFSFWYVHTDAIAGHTLNVGVGSAANAASMSPLGSIVDVVNTTYEKAAYLFTPVSSGVYYFGVQDVSLNTSPWYICTDDWRVGDPPSCPAPASFASTGVTATEASFTWVCAGCTGPYWIEYGVPGWTPGTNGSPGVGGTMAGPFAGTSGTVTGLTPGTSYSAVVRQDCAGTWSLNSNSVNFATTALVNTFPSCQDFELAVNCLPSTCTSVLACTSTSLTPVGWENSTADGTGNWSVDEGGTSSTATGPGTGAGTGQSDYVPGTTTGNYVYMESGSCAGNTIIANSPVYDVSSFANPNVRVQMAYNMYGATMGTMAIDIEDPAGSNTWTQLWSLSGDQGQGWFLTPTLDHAYTGTQVRYRVRGISGSSFTSDMAFDYFCVSEGPACTAPTATTAIVENCLAGTFTVEVTVTSTGDGATVDLVSDLDGVEHAAVTASPTPYVMGPYTVGQTVVITMEHENNVDCNVGLGSFASLCPPVVNTFPYCEDFEGATLCQPSTCTSVLACTGTALEAVGWDNSEADGTGNWSVDEGGTTSTATGPGNGSGSGQPDYVPGTSTGNYVYMESGSCAGNTIDVLSPVFDVTGMVNGSIRARMAYNMYGATMGTMSVQIEDPALSNNWTTLWTLSGDQGQGWFLTPNMDHVFTGPAVRYRVRGVSGTSFTSDMAFDYFCVRPTPLCTDPVATVTGATPDCSTNSLTVGVEVTSIGSATSVAVEASINNGPYTTVCSLNASGLCNIVAGSADVVAVRVRNEQDGDCLIDLGEYDAGALNCITCGAAATNETYCYVASDNKSWLYSSQGSGTLRLFFTRGTIETSNFDDLIIYDGPDNTYPVLFANPANTGNLGPAGSGILTTDPDFFAVDVTATGNFIFMTFTSDGSVQCATSAVYDPWEWTVVCFDCTFPTATATVNDNCGAGTFTITVDVTDATSSGAVDIVTDYVGDTEPSGVGVGQYVLGPYPNGTIVDVTVQHPTEAFCTITRSDLTSCCNATCAGALPAVVGTNSHGPINCGTATNALVNGTVPTGARWWSYTLPADGKVRVSSCNPPNTTNDDTFVTIHEGTCGSLVPYGGDDDGCTAFNFASDVTFTGAAGQTFYIEWDNRWNDNGHDWNLEFTACTPPANDLCSSENPAASPLSIGSPLVFTGTRDCATKDGTLSNIRFWDGVDEDVSGWVWESFLLTECANVQINYCGSPLSGVVALNMYGDCGNLFVNASNNNTTGCSPNFTINFANLAPGAYYYPVLWDARRASGAYTLNVIATAPTIPCVANIVCSGAIPLSCPGSVIGNTDNKLPTLPANACPFTNSAVSGGSLWYTYTAASDENIILSTCGAGTAFDTRISVFTGPDCNTLNCYTMSDDFGGACTTRSQLEFFAQSGQTYYIAVHSPSPFADGQFELQIGCGAVCPRPANDDCNNAQGIISYPQDGSGISTVGDNSCAQNDAYTTCTPVLNNQGVWYSFYSGPNTIHRMVLLGSAQSGGLTASQLNYALFSGSCGNLGATGQVVCVQDGDGYDIPLTGLTTDTDYLLYIYNPGSTGFEGTFEVLLEHPGVNDAGITDIISPTGLVCSSFLAPKVALTNFGEATLTSVDIVYDLNGGGPNQGPFTYTWTGSLPYEDTLVVDLPGFTAPYGTHTLNVTVQNPNGMADEIAINNSFSEPNIDVTGETVVVEITTDNDPSGIYWEIQDQAFQTVALAPVYNTGNTTETVPTCLSTLNGNCFSFYLFDFLGNGLSGTGNGNGNWRLRTTDGRTLLGDDFNGTINGVLSPNSPPATAGYVSGHEFCLPPGPSQPLAAECGVFTNLLQSKVFTSIVPGVTTYQFEFSDPDAGFRRRIAVPRNWVKFSEMVTSPLQPGVRYFTRVRVDQGAAGLADDRFGTGCEMGLDPTAVPGCTGLVDDIGFPAHSCGVIKTFGGSDKIFAQPVVGATQYRFRFENIGEGYLRTIVRPNYICPLNWVTLPLVNGSTYDVSVEVFYAGQWSGYCGPVCQVTILNPPAMAQQRDAEVVTNSGLQAWPNPVRDGAVNLRLDGLTAGTQRVSLEVYDLTGKRVVAQDMENSGPVFNTVLDLDGFAGGVYMVHLNVDGADHQQRISVVK